VVLPVPKDVVDCVQTYGVALEGALVAQLGAYLEALLETNRSFNLTAVTSPDEAWSRHIADSLSLVPDLRELPAGAEVVDVGSGGGLPGLPLAIALPQLRFTLVEATGKKARFLEQVARDLQLKNVRVANERAEVFGQSGQRGRYRAATSRALSRLPVLLELTLPLLELGGIKLAIKGEQAEAEVAEAARALNVLGGSMESMRRTPTGTVVRIRKVAPTPARYPRSPGEPKRSPLM
jgi:16S rRNA (guanine527-N7)-methyltransferase